jgi:hypothetical protein
MASAVPLDRQPFDRMVRWRTVAKVLSMGLVVRKCFQWPEQGSRHRSSSGLSETQKRTLRIADNKIALNAGWDLEILQLELGELGSIDVDIDLTLTGFSTGEIDVILTSPVDPDDEVIHPVPAMPITKPRDIWILGDHRVGCGDGRDAEFLQRVIGHGARVDAAFLDPPYNVRIGGHAVSAGSHREFAMASGEMSEAEFRSFLTDTLGAAARVSRDGAVHFVCMDWRHMDDVSAVGRTVYGDRLNLCIWNKSNAGTGSLYRSKHELVFIYRVGTAPHLNMVELGKHGRNRTTLAHRCRRRGRPSLPWKTTTFLAARRDDRIDAPSVFDGSIDGESFRTYVERGPRSYP